MALAAPTLDEVRAARERIKDGAVRTPLLNVELESGAIHAKLENLQPIGAFKIRGALNKMLTLPRAELKLGVYTASAGNMAQGVAYAARMLGVPAQVFVPDSAPRAKTDAVERLGALVQRVPYDEWWQIMQNGGRAGTRGTFVHPFADTHVMAGNGTIALEIIEDCPNVEAVLVPWGGGGLTCGIAATLRALRPSIRVYACEVQGAAPLEASRKANAPVQIKNQRTFIDGIGGRGVFPDIWPLARELVTDSLVVTDRQVADAVELLARHARVVAEGAGAAPVAAAIEHRSKLWPKPEKLVCIVSGGNIDASVLATILSGTVP